MSAHSGEGMVSAGISEGVISEGSDDGGVRERSGDKMSAGYALMVCSSMSLIPVKKDMV